MLDTIALSLNQTEVLNMARFTPSALGLYQPLYYSLGARGNISCFQNSTKKDFEQKIYKPRLTLTKRKAHVGFAITLRIEFSAPKLLHGNNFDELRDQDFGRVLDILHLTLAGMDVHVKKEVLKKAGISAIHYSKNIPLTDYSTCAMLLAELGKTNLNNRLDLSKTDYRNEGHAIRYHANSYELTFYDKIKDMWQAKISEKRAIEKDCAIQRDLFAKGAYKKPLEVLRMEIRLGNRTKIKSMLKTLGLEVALDFESMFKASIAQKMLQHFWQRITVDMPLLALAHFKPEDMYHAMTAQSKRATKPARILQHIGALAVMRNVGMRGLHSLVSTHSHARTWQRLKKELEGLDITASMKYAAARDVGHCLETFKPLRISNYTALQHKKPDGDICL